DKAAVQERVTGVEVEKTKIDQNLVHLEEERSKRRRTRHEIEQELMRIRVELDQIMAANPEYQPPSGATVEELAKQIERLEKRMRALEPVNMKALEEYNQT